MVQLSTTFAVTAMVAVAVDDAEAEVEVKPSVRSPRTTVGTTDLTRLVLVMRHCSSLGETKAPKFGKTQSQRIFQYTENKQDFTSLFLGCGASYPDDSVQIA